MGSRDICKVPHGLLRYTRRCHPSSAPDQRSRSAVALVPPPTGAGSRCLLNLAPSSPSRPAIASLALPPPPSIATVGTGDAHAICRCCLAAADPAAALVHLRRSSVLARDRSASPHPAVARAITPARRASRPETAVSEHEARWYDGAQVAPVAQKPLAAAPRSAAARVGQTAPYLPPGPLPGRLAAPSSPAHPIEASHRAALFRLAMASSDFDFVKRMTPPSYVFPSHRLQRTCEPGRVPLVLVACGSCEAPCP